MGSSRATVVSSFTIIKGSMIEETYAVMRDWDFARSREENLRDVRDNNTIGASSANWLRDVYKVLHRRFDPNKGDRALPMLAKASDPMKSLAQLELARPAIAKDQVRLADAWAAAGSLDESLVKDKFTQRAVHWYRLAVSSLTGLDRIVVEKKIEKHADD